MFARRTRPVFRTGTVVGPTTVNCFDVVVITVVFEPSTAIVVVVVNVVVFSVVVIVESGLEIIAICSLNLKAELADAIKRFACLIIASVDRWFGLGGNSHSSRAPTNKKLSLFDQNGHWS